MGAGRLFFAKNIMLLLHTLSAAAALQSPWTACSRRQLVVAGAGGLLGAETAWANAVTAATAAGVTSPEDVRLPSGAVEEIEAGRIVVVKNWLSQEELAVLRADAEASFAAGHFIADALASYGQKTKAGTNKGFDASTDRTVMPSFFPSKGTDGPWVDASIGNSAARQSFKARMGAVKAALSREMQGRKTLIADGKQTPSARRIAGTILVGDLVYDAARAVRHKRFEQLTERHRRRVELRQSLEIFHLLAQRCAAATR